MLRNLVILISLAYIPNILLGQVDTMLVFKRVMFTGYNVYGQVYYIDDILATDTVKTNFKDLKVEKFTYSAIVNGYQWEQNVEGNILTQYDKDRIKSIMQDGRKIYFFDIVVMDKAGKDYNLKQQTIMLKRRPTRYFN
jgi:hypothetical protein